MLNLNRSNFQAHPFHLVSPSPWPLYTSISLLSLTTSTIISLLINCYRSFNLDLALKNPPKPHSFTSLPLQSSLASAGSGGGAGSAKNNPIVIDHCPPHDWGLVRIDSYNRAAVSGRACENPTRTVYDPTRDRVNRLSPGHKLNERSGEGALASTYRKCTRCGMEICINCYREVHSSFFLITSFPILRYILPFISVLLPLFLFLVSFLIVFDLNIDLFTPYFLLNIINEIKS